MVSKYGFKVKWSNKTKQKLLPMQTFSSCLLKIACLLKLQFYGTKQVPAPIHNAWMYFSAYLSQHISTLAFYLLSLACHDNTSINSKPNIFDSYTLNNPPNSKFQDINYVEKAQVRMYTTNLPPNWKSKQFFWTFLYYPFQ